MVKRTICIENPCKLNVKNRQLIIINKETGEIYSIPLEDIGYVVMDNREISYTQSTIEQFAAENIATVFCTSNHMPTAMLLNFHTNQTQTAKINAQIEASEPMKKSIWKQVIEAKIKNQSLVLKYLGKEYSKVVKLSREVKSGDTDNREAVASRIYWGKLFEDLDDFRRERDGEPPNNFLNYGYAVLRAATARALCGSGLLPLIGVHHSNKYNPFCLADDMMEPYRPFVDIMVHEYVTKYPEEKELDTKYKRHILSLLTLDSKFANVTRPLMIGLTMTSASLAKYFLKETTKLSFGTVTW